MRWIFCALSLVPFALTTPLNHKIEISVKDATHSEALNVHLTYTNVTLKDHVFTYGGCDAPSFTTTHDTIAHIPGGDFGGDHTRLVWVVPKDVSNHGCISAWEQDNVLIGRSQPLSLDEILKTTLFKRDRIMMTNDSGIDAEGPWFNGVDTLKNKEIGVVDARAAKNKCEDANVEVCRNLSNKAKLAIGIIGSGMSGLMTYVWFSILVHLFSFG